MIKIDKELTKILDKWLQWKWQYDEIAGISIGIMKDGKVFYKNQFGYMNLKKGVATTPLTTYRIASISKVFTGLGILKLVEQKKLKLTDKVSAYLPQFNTKQTKDISILQLLLHTSLITRDGNYGQWGTGKFPQEEELLKQLNKEFKFKAPNSKWKYSNVGYSILGILIARVSKMNYEDFMQKHILKPLEMKHTSSVLSGNVINNLATGYSTSYPGFKGKAYKHSETYAMAGATGFTSNVDDLLKFGQAIINRSDKILNKATWNIAFKTHILSKEDKRNPFTFHVRKVGKNVWGHGGSYPGFLTRLNFDIKNNLVIVVMINSNSAPIFSYGNGLYKTLEAYPSFQKKLAKVKPTKNGSRFEGHFGERWGAFETVWLKDRLMTFGHPSFNPLENPAFLEPIKENLFRIHDSDPYASDNEIAEFKFTNGKLSGINWAGLEYPLIK